MLVRKFQLITRTSLSANRIRYKRRFISRQRQKIKRNFSERKSRAGLKIKFLGRRKATTSFFSSLDTYFSAQPKLNFNVSGSQENKFLEPKWYAKENYTKLRVQEDQDKVLNLGEDFGARETKSSSNSESFSAFTLNLKVFTKKDFCFLWRQLRAQETYRLERKYNQTEPTYYYRSQLKNLGYILHTLLLYFRFEQKLKRSLEKQLKVVKNPIKLKKLRQYLRSDERKSFTPFLSKASKKIRTRVQLQPRGGSSFRFNHLFFTNKVVNLLMRRGKKSKAIRILQNLNTQLGRGLGHLPAKESGLDAIALLHLMVKKIRPIFSIRKYRFKRRTNRVPYILPRARSESTAISWILDAAYRRKKRAPYKSSSMVLLEEMESYLGPVFKLNFLAHQAAKTRRYRRLARFQFESTILTPIKEKKHESYIYNQSLEYNLKELKCRIRKLISQKKLRNSKKVKQKHISRKNSAKTMITVLPSTKKRIFVPKMIKTKKLRKKKSSTKTKQNLIFGQGQLRGRSRPSWKGKAIRISRKWQRVLRLQQKLAALLLKPVLSVCYRKNKWKSISENEQKVFSNLDNRIIENLVGKENKKDFGVVCSLANLQKFCRQRQILDQIEKRRLEGLEKDKKIEANLLVKGFEWTFLSYKGWKIPALNQAQTFIILKSQLESSLKAHIDLKCVLSLSELDHLFEPLRRAFKPKWKLKHLFGIHLIRYIKEFQIRMEEAIEFSKLLSVVTDSLISALTTEIVLKKKTFDQTQLQRISKYQISSEKQQHWENLKNQLLGQVEVNKSQEEVSGSGSISSSRSKFFNSTSRLKLKLTSTSKAQGKKHNPNPNPYRSRRRLPFFSTRHKPRGLSTRKLVLEVLSPEYRKPFLLSNELQVQRPENLKIHQNKRLVSFLFAARTKTSAGDEMIKNPGLMMKETNLNVSVQRKLKTSLQIRKYLEELELANQFSLEYQKVLASISPEKLSEISFGDLQEEFLTIFQQELDRKEKEERVLETEVDLSGRDQKFLFLNVKKKKNLETKNQLQNKQTSRQPKVIHLRKKKSLETKNQFQDKQTSQQPRTIHLRKKKNLETKNQFQDKQTPRQPRVIHLRKKKNLETKNQFQDKQENRKTKKP